jgi:tellurite resistance protein TerA
VATQHKVTLNQPGDRAKLKKSARITAKLTWTKPVDLDLHAFYKTKEGVFGHIYYDNQGDLLNPPCIELDEDAGVDDTGGDNEENITIKSLSHVEAVLIATNIYRRFGFLSFGDNFAKYDGKVVVETNLGDHIEVPLDSEKKGKWCVIAQIDNSDPSDPYVVNINKVQKSEPNLRDF